MRTAAGAKQKAVRLEPLGVIDKGSGGESVQDPSFLHAGWREEASSGPQEALRE